MDYFVVMVLAFVCLALGHGWHSRRFCPHLSAAAAFILCDGTWADKVFLACGAWLRPAFPLLEGTNQEQNPEDEELRQAMAMSLEAPHPDPGPHVVDQVGLELGDLSDEGSGDEDLNTAIGLSLGVVDPLRLQDDRAALPAGMEVMPVTPGGWCFYECFLRHIGQLELPILNRYSLAMVMLENLARNREVFEDWVAIPAQECDKVMADVLRVRDYAAVSGKLGDFEYYVLSKLESAMKRVTVQDERNYADTPEIAAILRTCHLNVLRVRPPSQWEEKRSLDSVLRLGKDDKQIWTESELQGHMQSTDTHLKLVHYQYDGYEHYDVITLGGGVVPIPETCACRLEALLQSSKLVEHAEAQDKAAFRRHALEVLGIAQADGQGAAAGETSDEESAGTSLSSSSSSATSGHSGQSMSESESEGSENRFALPIPSLHETGSSEQARPSKFGLRLCAAYSLGIAKKHLNAKQGAGADDLEKPGREEDRRSEAASDDTDDCSELSDNSDLFSTAVDTSKTWTTEQDAEREHVVRIAALLRKRPMLPADPTDDKHERDWLDVSSGVALPRAHCAFKGCSWTNDTPIEWEVRLKDHLRLKHLPAMALPASLADSAYDFYTEAIEHQERQAMPAIGPSIDRRTFKLLDEVYNDKDVYSLVCFVCGQVHTHTGLKAYRADSNEAVHLSNIRLWDRGGSILLKWLENDRERFDNTLGLNTFRRKYAESWKDHKVSWSDPDISKKVREFGPDKYEWQRELTKRSKPVMEMLCCPEDVPLCIQKHGPEKVCERCRIPICTACYHLMDRGMGVPMALANDNFWGYTSHIITKYKVRWIEMAAILPYWTSMICYYVEGDFGHVMTEQVGRMQYRAAYRGQCFTFIMPWDDIVQDLNRRMTDADLKNLPRDPECLRYMLRLHLRVAGKDFHQHLKQVHLRPGVLVLLIKELIDRKHGAYENWASKCLKNRMTVREIVQKKYPDANEGVPLVEQKGMIPDSIREELEDQEAFKDTVPKQSSTKPVVTVKNATPGDVAKNVATCLDDIRPKAFTVDRDAGSCSTPDVMRTEALQRYGDLHIQTGSKFLPQWHSRYSAQILPFVIPRMCSGPDYSEDDRWRRGSKLTDPIVTPAAWMKGLTRSVLAQVRNDAVAIPITRSTWFRHAAEHSVSVLRPYTGKRGQPQSEVANELVQAAQALQHHLWHGFSGSVKNKQHA